MDSQNKEVALVDEQEKTELATKAGNFLDFAQEYEIVDDETMLEADEFSSKAHKKKKDIENFFEKHVSSAYAVWKGLTSDRKAIIDPYDKGSKLLSQKVISYKEKKDREAREKAEKERLAEQKRLDEERAAEIKREREKRQEEAEKAKKLGHVKEAKEIEQMPIAEPERKIATYHEVIAAPATKTKVKTDYKFTLDSNDKSEQFKVIPVLYWDLNVAKIQKHVREEKGKANIPGITQFTTKEPIRKG